MEKNLPLDELSTAVGRIKGLLLTEEKVDRAVQTLARAIKDEFRARSGPGCPSWTPVAAGPAPDSPTV